MRGSGPASGPAAEGYSAMRELYNAHVDQVHELHSSMLEEAPRRLAAMEDYAEEELRLARGFVDDVALIFRFLRRARFDTENARNMLYKTLQWRLEADIDDLATDLLHSQYISGTANGIPLFWIHSRFRDRMGRPCLYVRLQQVERAPDGLRDLKTNIIASMDVMRRYLRKVNRRAPRAAPVLQGVLAIDVAESGISNFELELLPFLVDLLKNHYPGLFGTVYVLHYGWLQSGLWRMLKPVLPPKLLARIMFVSDADLRQQFDVALPKVLGGSLNVPIKPDTSDIFNYYARSAAWRKDEGAENEPVPPALRVRGPDFESIYDVMSRVGSPMTPMTPMTSMPGTPRVRASSSPQLVGTAAATQLDERHASSRRHRRRASDPLDIGGTFAHTEVHTEPAGPSLMQWLTNWMQPRASNASPPRTPAAQVDTASIPRLEMPGALTPRARTPETEMPPTYANAENNTVTRYLSWRAHKYAQMDGHVSPYNIENPYFGYPAAYVEYDEPTDAASTTTSVVNVTDASTQSGLSRQLRVRRRKRDLLRTLAYLFVLRLLNAYRHVRRNAGVVYWMVVGERTRESVSRAAWRSLTRTASDTRANLAGLAHMRIIRALFVVGVLFALRLAPTQRLRGVMQGRSS